MTLTKQDIDALVDGMMPVFSNSNDEAWIGSTRVHVGCMRKSLYLAAGLTAEGARKPERVRCWMFDDGSIINTEPNPAYGLGPTTPGWFVPSEEGET